MKSVVIIVLSVLLAAALVSSYILYGNYVDKKDAFLNSEKKLSDLNEKVSVLDREISEYEARFRTSERDFKKEGEIKDAMIAGLQAQLDEAQSHILYLDAEIAKQLNILEGLEGRLIDIAGEKNTVESRISSMKSTYESLLSERSEELKAAQKRISELENTINAKDRKISEYEARFRTSERDFKKEGEIKDAMIAGLQTQLDEARSRNHNLDTEITRKLRTLEGLEGRLIDIEGQKTTVESRMSSMKSTYDSLLSDLKGRIENQEVTIKTFKEKISVSFVDRILFGFARTTITPEGREILDRVGEVLKKIKDRKIRIIGHTDNIPIRTEYRYKFPSNWELSAARAAAVVRNFHETIGLDPKNMEAVGHSFYAPVADNDTDDGRAQNRRVEIIIAPNIQ